MLNLSEVINAQTGPGCPPRKYNISTLYKQAVIELAIIALVELARRFFAKKRRGNLVELVLCACIDGWEVIVRS